ncbi:galactoside O-acetyltransferase [Shewanella baltica]|uniref:acyltransferase n=1 Tax=Shewanella baltica TaxID=62322 RepID=UPI0007B4A3CF|nr:acyltransferase [Shewanella baltica]KZK71075.1 galactoside O-acetyltransferase [Shewanella baltica]
MAYLTRNELEKMGFASVGEEVFISDKASIYGAERITLGNNIRIDDFCVLSAGVGGIVIGDYVHIAVFSLLIGAGKIMLSDYSGLSSRVSVYSSNDDYSGKYMTNPTVPDEFTNVRHADVFIGKHVVVGSGCVILPGVTLGNGVAVGSLSMITKNCEEFGIYLGVPAKKIKNRKRDLLDLEGRLNKI